MALHLQSGCMTQNFPAVLMVLSSFVCLQEEVVPFFSQVRLSPESNTAELAYLELARKVWLRAGHQALLDRRALGQGLQGTF